MRHLFLISLFGLGCTAPKLPFFASEYIEWCIYDATIEQGHVIEDSINEWNSKTDTNWIIGGNCSGTITGVSEVKSRKESLFDKTVYIEFLNIEAGNRLQNLMLYQLGHVAGLPDSNNPEDVMYPYIVEPYKVELSIGDIEVYNQIHKE